MFVLEWMTVNWWWSGWLWESNRDVWKCSSFLLLPKIISLSINYSSSNKNWSTSRKLVIFHHSVAGVLRLARALFLVFLQVLSKGTMLQVSRHPCRTFLNASNLTYHTHTAWQIVYTVNYPISKVVNQFNFYSELQVRCRVNVVIKIQMTKFISDWVKHLAFTRFLNQ